LYNHFLARVSGGVDEYYNVINAKKHLTVIKKLERFEWLSLSPVAPLQNSLFALQSAFKNLREGRTKWPRFKKRSNRSAAKYTGTSFSIRGGRISLSRLPGVIKVNWHRPLPSDSKVSSVTIIQDPDGRYYASFVVQFEVEPLPQKANVVGVDFGITDIVVTSDGYKTQGVKHIDALQERLKKQQRILSRREKGSGRWHKQRKKVAVIHRRIRDARSHFLHNISSHLVKNYGTICIEDLNVSGMVRNRSLARAISDAGFRMLRQQLEYKSEWYGRELKTVSRWEPTSKTCSHCGHKKDKLPLSVRLWTCPKCGSEHDRDVNAAINIRNVAMGYRQSDTAGKPPVAVRGPGSSGVHQLALALG
jgi:putative transposase